MATRKTISIPPYEFTVIDNPSVYGDRIIYRTFRIGGVYEDCVSVTVYYTDGKPTHGKIVHAMYDPECSRGIPLDQRGGSVRMIKALLRHIHEQIPEVHRFVFEDYSAIECGTEAEQRQKRHRKRGTHAFPLTLSGLYMVTHGMSWYEKHFGARQIDGDERYRATLSALLTGPIPPFDTFLGICMVPQEQWEELGRYYAASRTYKEFFTSVPYADRCRLYRPWLKNFIDFYLIKPRIWVAESCVIDIRDMPADEPVRGGGGGGGGGGRRRTRRRVRGGMQIVQWVPWSNVGGSFLDRE